MSADLAIQGVTKRFQGLTALNDITLELETERSTGVIGPNGSGKTTLFNVVTGYLRPERGRIRWRGRDIAGRSPHAIARQGLVRTFQQTMLFPDFTVRRNVEVAAMSAGIRGRGRTVAVDHALETLRIADYGEEPAGRIPFGIARRVGVACTLPLRPSLLLLDEPAAGLNAQEAEELAGALRALRADGYGVCLVDHNMDFVTGFCDRIVVMSAGRTLIEGTPDEIVHSSQVAEVYLGHAAQG